MTPDVVQPVNKIIPKSIVYNFINPNLFYALKE